MMTLLLLLLLIHFQIILPTDSASIEFQNNALDNWQLLIGANREEFHYDFCQYNATSGGKRCKNFPKFASIQMMEVCNCFVHHIDFEADSFSFEIVCQNNSSSCPSDLTLSYQEGANPNASNAGSQRNNSLSIFIALFILGSEY